MWEIENIPDEDHLYYRLHKSYIVEGKILPGAFQERGEGTERGMSTDWSRYSTAIETLNRSKSPTQNGIVEFSVKQIKQIDILEVLHAPLPDNRAHSHIKGIPHQGQLKTQVRFHLKRILNWVILPEGEILS